MQVIVTSYCRLKYLKQTVESLRQDPIQLYIVDGGSDPETREYIREVSDGHLFFDGNPGADHLKTAGIKQFVTDPEFIISSDDLKYPAGYSELILRQYRAINTGHDKWTFVACNMPHIQVPGWSKVNGVALYEVGTSQVAGAILSLEACKKVGYFPVYGRSGQGDWAISRRLRIAGYRLAYWQQPVIEHIGWTKFTDYPEYSAQFKEDEERWIKAAQQDILKDKV